MAYNNSTNISGYPSVTIASGDLVIVQDITNANVLSTGTAQQIADLAVAVSAPIGATYITQTPNGTLTNEQALSVLASGIMKSTTATGVVSIASAGTDYVAPATTITVNGTAAEITSSAGAQDLSANRTWTLSLPAALTFTGKTITGGAYASASATLFTFTTGSIGTAVTGVTQAASNNSTLIATTAYVDNQATTAAALRAPANATYIVQTANGTLTNEQALGDLAGGILKSAVTTGIVSIAAQGTDYYAPGGTDVIVADGGTGVGTFVAYTPICGGTTGTGSLQSVAALGSSGDILTSNGAGALPTFQPASGGGANTALSNLAAVAINTTLVSDTDVTDNLGTQAIRWNNIYSATLQTGDTAADTLNIGAWDVDGASISNFITLTANNTPTCVLASGVTGTTQAGSDNSTKLATTAYSDAQATTAAALRAPANATYIVQTADVTLTNEQALGALATGILKNTTTSGVLSIAAQGTDYYAPGGTDVALADGGTGATLADPNADRIMFWDDSAGQVTWLTAGTGLTITGTTIDASGAGANAALSNLASVAINTTLVSDTDVTDDLGTLAIRWNNIYAAKLSSGDTAADVLTISAYDVDGAATTDFITLTSNNTPTCVLSSAVTGTTQTALDSSTKIATTAYVDSAVAAVSAGSVNLGLTYLVSNSIFSN